MPKTEMPAWKCERCSHVWPRKNDEEKPVTCPNPKCRSVYWDKERKRLEDYGTDNTGNIV